MLYLLLALAIGFFFIGMSRELYIYKKYKPLNESKGTFVSSPNAKLPPAAFKEKYITTKEDN